MTGASPVQPPAVGVCLSATATNQAAPNAFCIYIMQSDKWLCVFRPPSVINGTH